VNPRFTPADLAVVIPAHDAAGSGDPKGLAVTPDPHLGEHRKAAAACLDAAAINSAGITATAEAGNATTMSSTRCSAKWIARGDHGVW